MAFLFSHFSENGQEKKHYNFSPPSLNQNSLHWSSQPVALFKFLEGVLLAPHAKLTVQSWHSRAFQGVNTFCPFFFAVPAIQNIILSILLNRTVIIISFGSFAPGLSLESRTGRSFERTAGSLPVLFLLHERGIFFAYASSTVF